REARLAAEAEAQRQRDAALAEQQQDEAARREADAVALQRQQETERQRAEALALQKQQEAEQAERRRAEALALQQREEEERLRLARQEEARRLAVQREDQARREAMELEARKQEEQTRRQAALQREAEERAARLAQEQAAREQAAREQAAKEQAAKEQAARDETARQAEAARQRERMAADSRPGEGERAEPLPRGLGGGGSLAARALDQVRRMDPSTLAARPAVPLPPLPENPRRYSLFGQPERDINLRMYVESWKMKIERNGNLNYAQSSKDRARGDPIVTVALRSDGSVEDVVINRSSGRPELDEAVRRIVRVNARYSAFPPEIARRFDVIEIRRIWNFDETLRILEEMR
ncbi:cell envelope integrity protein TolA, partial [Oxalobacteraceae bacterium OM1]